MLDELLDFDRDGREQRNGGATPQRRGGIRGLLDRLLGGDDHDDDDRSRDGEGSDRRGPRSRRDDRDSFFDD